MMAATSERIVTTPTSTGTVPIEQLRAQLYKTLLQRSDDPEVRRRLDAVLLELRLLEGVGERPVGSARAQDPVVDLFLRLLGIGDDTSKPAKLAEPLTTAQERAAWVATRVFVEPEVEGEEPAPEWAVTTAQKEKERTIIGWQPDEAELSDIDPDAALEELEQSVKEFADGPSSDFEDALPTRVDIASQQLEPPKPVDGSLVSFGDSAEFDEAMKGEFYDVNARFQTLADPPEAELPYQPAADANLAEVDVADGWDSDPEADAAAVEAALAAAAAMSGQPAPTPAPTPRRSTATPAPAPAPAPADDTEDGRRRAIFEAADQRISKRPAAPRQTLPHATPRPPEERTAEEVADEANKVRLVRQRNLGLVAALAGVLVLLFTSGVGFAAFQGSRGVNIAATTADSARSSLYNAIASDPSLVESVGDLGGDEAALRERWLAYSESNDDDRARRALAFAAELQDQWRQIRPGGSRYLRAEQPVKRILRSQEAYQETVQAWAASTRSPLGALATTVGLARSPSAEALVPLE
ncbi:MAG: hypothetical protein ACI8PZ_000386 [Myxococcota bacterium]|jgi:hypothetical protein